MIMYIYIYMYVPGRYMYIDLYGCVCGGGEGGGHQLLGVRGRGGGNCCGPVVVRKSVG